MKDINGMTIKEGDRVRVKSLEYTGDGDVMDVVSEYTVRNLEDLKGGNIFSIEVIGFGE